MTKVVIKTSLTTGWLSRRLKVTIGGVLCGYMPPHTFNGIAYTVNCPNGGLEGKTIKVETTVSKTGIDVESIEVYGYMCTILG